MLGHEPAHLGEQIDIHGGGNDLIFPHHENEIAQSEAFTGKQFARYWIHNGMLQLSGEKMSKSIGNLVTIEDFLANHTADTLRMMVLNSGYRGPLTFNDKVIQQAETALDRLASALKPALTDAAGISDTGMQSLRDQMKKTREGFENAMDDDFNTAGALGNLFDLVRAVNQARADGASNDQLADAQTNFKKLSSVFGLQLKKSEKIEPAAPYKEDLARILNEVKKAEVYNLSNDFQIAVTNLESLYIRADETSIYSFGDSLGELRDISRNLKAFGTADYLRDSLNQLGFSVEDSRGGTIIFRK